MIPFHIDYFFWKWTKIQAFVFGILYSTLKVILLQYKSYPRPYKTALEYDHLDHIRIYYHKITKETKCALYFNSKQVDFGVGSKFVVVVNVTYIFFAKVRDSTARFAEVSS